MGIDPFWPTYLASVNVLCVPAATLSPQRFAQIFDTINTIGEVRVADIGSDDDYQNGLLKTLDPKG